VRGRLRKKWLSTAGLSFPSRVLLIGAWGIQKVKDQLTDNRYRRMGLDTAGGDDALFGAGRESYGYVATPWRVLRQVFPRGSLSANDVLLEYGCGKGRTAIWVSSRFPVRRIIGIEIDEAVYAAAQANLERWRGPRRCESVQFVCADATQFQVPDDVTTVYFYNPFRGATFDQVLQNLLASLARQPRLLKVVYFHPIMHESLVNAGFTVKQERPNRSWVPTQSARSGVEDQEPWWPANEWTIYQSTESMTGVS
jgi:SAM-dependent methyltransferase